MAVWFKNLYFLFYSHIKEPKSFQRRPPVRSKPAFPTPFPAVYGPQFQGLALFSTPFSDALMRFWWVSHLTYLTVLPSTKPWVRYFFNVILPYCQILKNAIRQLLAPPQLIQKSFFLGAGAACSVQRGRLISVLNDHGALGMPTSSAKEN